MRRYFRRALMALAILAALATPVLLAGWITWRDQVEGSRLSMSSEVNVAPPMEVGLVLGTSPLTGGRGGRPTWPNLSFGKRLDAAAALWREGKVRYLIVSGNRAGDYDEPTAMRDGLIARGVPENIIYRDFAGYRTNDSLLRARDIFGQKRLIVVSQATHLTRALYLARHAGIDAWGFEAVSVHNPNPRLRDLLSFWAAALRARWDVLVDTPAREGGAPVAIGVDPPA